MRRSFLAGFSAALLLLAFGAPPLRAQPAPTDTLAARPLSADALEAYRSDSEFVYEEGGGEPSASIWGRIWQWIVENTLGPIFSPELRGVRKAVLYALLALILGAAVLKLLQMEGGGVFRRSSARAAGLGLSEEELRAMDFPGLIAEAEAAGDLRRATRLRYLHLLRRLVDADRLGYAPDYTNRFYVRTLAATPLHAPFSAATERFETSYYGDALVGEAEYAKLVADCAAVNDALSATDETARQAEEPQREVMA